MPLAWAGGAAILGSRLVTALANARRAITARVVLAGAGCTWASSCSFAGEVRSAAKFADLHSAAAGHRILALDDDNRTSDRKIVPDRIALADDRSFLVGKGDAACYEFGVRIGRNDFDVASIFCAKVDIEAERR